jgi:hypothetical protein
VDLDPFLIDVLTAIGVVLLAGIPLAIAAGMLWLARRHLSGRRGRFDGLFSGIGRANAMNSHLQAGTPDPDELAVPLPPAAGRGRRRRVRRR